MEAIGIKDEKQEIVNNDDNSTDEEEFYIMADTGNEIEQSLILKHVENGDVRSVDLDGDNPYLQIGPFTFQGHYEYVLGTNMFFTTTSTPINQDTDDHSNQNLQLIGTSDKKLNLTRCYIYPKEQITTTTTKD
ncbi:unnamed protein product [Didymodactylos carnosus]|uniref:Transcription factor TFIIIC triple barrel domain-containing protein n=1 Tax=Didymodactylos carnosus TaxID=1234261 RepID=A0A814KGP2_9BILA|nr:unnamed protein product [Didymodactylos carnosus]CAF1049252.1 unnamed protein product [Didymodactylos carnosus]CAF3716250.1 unnamed protein product [Didymodactylos carnosus]CAF3818892.1 unnamed protein product [Didymodactylos carnosus]